jgi:hypothetical protein
MDYSSENKNNEKALLLGNLIIQKINPYNFEKISHF